MNAASNNIRHAVSKQTGATTLAFRKGRGEWEVQCLSHKTSTTVATRGDAWKTSSHPALFCAKCKPIAAGKGTRIEGKVPMPTMKVAAAAPKKPGAAKPAAPGKGKPAPKPAASKTTQTRKATTGKVA